MQHAQHHPNHDSTFPRFVPTDMTYKEMTLTRPRLLAMHALARLVTGRGGVGGQAAIVLDTLWLPAHPAEAD
jgi:hypothetical protein